MDVFDYFIAFWVQNMSRDTVLISVYFLKVRWVIFREARNSELALKA